MSSDCCNANLQVSLMRWRTPCVKCEVWGFITLVNCSSKGTCPCGICLSSINYSVNLYFPVMYVQQMARLAECWKGKSWNLPWCIAKELKKDFMPCPLIGTPGAWWPPDLLWFWKQNQSFLHCPESYRCPDRGQWWVVSLRGQHWDQYCLIPS